MIGTTKSDMRHANRQAVLQLLLERGALSRVELSALTGLSGPTLSVIAGELLAWGLIVESGSTASTGGRRPVLLTLNGSLGHVAGLDILPDRVTLTILDVAGRVTIQVHETVTGDPCEAAVALYLRQAPQGRRLALCASVPGVVDQAAGLVRLSSPLGWQNHPLREKLEAQLACPVAIENDANCAGLAEHRALGEKAPSDMLYLALRPNIGGALILAGRLHRGRHGAAGEIGHFVPGRERLGDYRQGAGALSFLFDQSWIAERSRGTPLAAKLPLTAVELFDAALDGEATAEQLRQELLENITTIIANSTALLDLEEIVLGGAVFQAEEVARVRGWLEQLVPSPPRIVGGRLGDRAAALGAAHLALEAAHRNLAASLAGNEREVSVQRR